MRKTPRLGQHFLIDRSVLKAILEASELNPGDGVIEVGPGKGILTQALVEQAGRVLALELDEDLAARLQAKYTQPNIEIRQVDARRLHWGDVAESLRVLGFTPVKLIANLPYYLATQMVIHALADPQGCDRLVVMVQEEVGRRMCAQPGGKDYSAYSVAVQYYGLPRYVIKVPAKAFRPMPRVASAVVRIDRRAQPPVALKDPDRFFYIMHAMFTHRRKTLRNCLQGTPNAPSLPAWEQAIAAAGLDPQRRPETLSLDELAGLINQIHPFTRPENIVD